MGARATTSARAEDTVRPRSQYLGIRRHGAGWQAYVRIDGRLVTKSFPLATSAEAMQAWRSAIKDRRLPLQAARGTFAGDVSAYLLRKQAMPTYAQRVRHMQWWVEQLGGGRPSASLEAHDIAVALQRLLVAEHNPATVKLIRSALSNFFTTMWGKAGANPVRDVPVPKQAPPQIRSVPYATIRALLTAGPLCPSRARLALVAYTGIPPAQIQTIRKTDIDWERRELRVRGRRKGAGSGERTIPLCDAALEALKEFNALSAYGPFDTPSLNHYCRRWAARLTPPQDITPYMLRHSFLTEIYRLTGDLGTTGRLAGHALHSPITRVYVGAAVSDVDRAAIAAFGAKVTG